MEENKARRIFLPWSKSMRSCGIVALTKGEHDYGFIVSAEET
jgi:hypothetical protein